MKAAPLLLLCHLNTKNFYEKSVKERENAFEYNFTSTYQQKKLKLLHSLFPELTKGNSQFALIYAHIIRHVDKMQHFFLLLKSRRGQCLLERGIDAPSEFFLRFSGENPAKCESMVK